MGTGIFFPGLKSGRGVTLTPHPLLVPWSRKGRAIPLLPLWAVRPVQSYGPYGLYRASVPVQGCTLPCLLAQRFQMANSLHELSVLLVYSHFGSVNGCSCRTSGFCKTTCHCILFLFIIYIMKQFEFQSVGCRIISA